MPWLSGLRARGGFSVDVTWEEGRVVTARVGAERAGSVTVRIAGEAHSVSLAAGSAWSFPRRAPVAGGEAAGGGEAASTRTG